MGKQQRQPGLHNPVRDVDRLAARVTSQKRACMSMYTDASTYRRIRTCLITSRSAACGSLVKVRTSGRASRRWSSAGPRTIPQRYLRWTGSGPPGVVVPGQLEPAAALEDEVEHDSERSHREDRERVTQFPAQFGHVPEVHAVDGDYQGRREENRRPSGDAFDILVLVQAGLGQSFDLIVLALSDEGGVDGQRVLEQGAEGVDAFDDPQDVVADVAEVTLQLDIDVVLIEPGAERIDDVEQRPGGPLDLDHLTSEGVDAAGDGGVVIEELILDFVDVVLQSCNDGGRT